MDLGPAESSTEIKCLGGAPGSGINKKYVLLKVFNRYRRVIKNYLFVFYLHGNSNLKKKTSGED